MAQKFIPQLSTQSSSDERYVVNAFVEALLVLLNYWSSQGRLYYLCTPSSTKLVKQNNNNMVHGQAAVFNVICLVIALSVMR